jgi:hypothetical protein
LGIVQERLSMFELKNEETLMFSDDHSVVLTTHRVIHHAGSDKQQVMLEDFLNYELKDYHIGNYKILTVIFTTITVFILLAKGYNRLWPFEYSLGKVPWILSLVTYENYMLVASLFPLTISFIFLLLSRRLLIRVNGKFNSIEFRVARFNKKSINRFLTNLESQAKKIKHENQTLYE